MKPYFVDRRCRTSKITVYVPARSSVDDAAIDRWLWDPTGEHAPAVNHWLGRLEEVAP